MIELNIPGGKTITVEHLVLDYNGTIAMDGTIIEGVKEKLNQLSKVLEIHIITADTFGRAAESLKDVNCKLKIISGQDQRTQKRNFIEELGKDFVTAIGNGANDKAMLETAALGIVLIQKEGASVKTVLNADIICTNIIDALELLENPKRVAATLRF